MPYYNHNIKCNIAIYGCAKLWSLQWDGFAPHLRKSMQETNKITNWRSPNWFNSSEEKESTSPKCNESIGEKKTISFNENTQSVFGAHLNETQKKRRKKEKQIYCLWVCYALMYAIERWHHKLINMEKAASQTLAVLTKPSSFVEFALLCLHWMCLYVLFIVVTVIV